MSSVVSSLIRESPTDHPSGYTHAGWAEAFPWLAQGITRGGSGEDACDLGIFSGASPAAPVLARWERLRRATGALRVVHAKQPHGATVRFHRSGPPGLLLAEPCDGHATADPGVLLAVSVADCVPVTVVDPEHRAVAVLHAGWRGVAAGVLERGVQVLEERCAARTHALHVHLGPSICGRCYEVGPEVFAALGLPEPAGPAPLDLRAVLAERACAAGVARKRVTVSEHCVRCGEGSFFSHRAGDEERQVAYAMVRMPGARNHPERRGIPVTHA